MYKRIDNNQNSWRWNEHSIIARREGIFLLYYAFNREQETLIMLRVKLPPEYFSITGYSTFWF